MGQILFSFETARHVYTVSELTREIRSELEPKFSDVWLSGEVSNFRPAASGHLYFTLKDATAQIRVACFRNQARYLKFRPSDGISLIARGKLAVYEPRGEYQLIAEYIEPAGIGALQLAFEQLRKKLAAEGLFSAERKRPLPLLPRTVGVVTSPTGAVIRDIVRVLHRRFANVNVLLYPALVQGESAAAEIAEGIRAFNRLGVADVIIVARGGGSIEDLWAFNEELVARVIAASDIPVISAVGHETDFTIADFVADLRAPTPSAAAELVVRCKDDFEAELRNMQRRLLQIIRLKLATLREAATSVSTSRALQTMPMRLAGKLQLLDEVTGRMDRAIENRIAAARRQAAGSAAAFFGIDVRRIVEVKRAGMTQAWVSLDTARSKRFTAVSHQLAQLQALLRERNPRSILSRGYAVVRNVEGHIIRSASDVAEGGAISIELQQGQLEAEVKQRRF